MGSRFLYELTERKPPEGWIPAGEDRPPEQKTPRRKRTSRAAGQRRTPARRARS